VASASLAEQHHRLAYKIAYTVTGLTYGPLYEELVSAGFLALVECEERFDTSRGVPFKAFAGRRIHGAILDALRFEHGMRGKRRREPMLSLEELPVHPRARHDTEAEALELLEAEAALHRLAELEAIHPRAGYTVRRRYEGATNVEVAHELGVTASRASQYRAMMSKAAA
jgi:RNA polymerase sigma factor (sigma-70 family)